MPRIGAITLGLVLVAANYGAVGADVDCVPIPAIGSGVCRDKKGHDCSKNGVERQPRLCAAPDPQYTAEAAAAHVTGTVVLSFRLSAQGCAENIRVIRGLGYGLDEAAVYALERYRWQKRKKQISYIEMQFYFNPLYHSTKVPTFPECSTQPEARK